MRTLFGVIQLVIIAVVLVVAFSAQIKTAKLKSKAHTQRLQKRNEARAKARGGTHLGHDHIKSTELSDNRKLEQLKALKEAGLLTQEEFNAAWEKVMKKSAAGL